MTWISSIASQIMDAVSGLFLNALGTDMVTMEEYFPFITKAFDVMQYTAWAVLFLIVVWQLFRAFGGPITEAENPWQLVVRGAIFALLIGYAKPIFMLALDIARAPYTALMDVSMTAEEFTFAGVEQVLSNGLLTIVSTVTVVGPILVLILLIALGWNYFKLLLEAVERYIVVGVLCYTSPLAFCMGGSKATNQVFKSWCRMVGSQLLLLVMNVWFIRGFNSSVGQYIGNGGALSTGQGSIFLWLFCALAFLKTAQKFDSYMAAMGLNVAQTGSSMGMELLMAARVISGVGHSAKSAGSVFGRGGSTATGTGAAASGFASGFASRFKGNSYVRDAVVDGGTRMGMGGGVGFVGRVFGGVAARNGAMLTGESISSVAARPAEAAGTIAGDIADRSLGNYMPQLAGHTLKGTQISGGHISTTATGTDGKVSSVEGGKAVAEIAAGTAAGGPWGAILSAAWAMRHTLFKILVCICLFFLVIIVLIVSLPSVVTNSVFGLDGSMVDMENPTTLLESYNDLAADISAVVEEGYDAALAKVEQIIEDGGYDYDLSMDALINYAQGSAGYDVSYILAAYSASLQQRNTGKEDMLAKLRSVADSMFPVSFVEKESEQIVPFTYATYRPVTVTVVTSKTQTGTINGVPQYRYTTARRTYYEPDETITTSEPVNVAAYTPVAVSVPIYSGGRITGTRSEIYYEQGGTETLTPETEVVKYVECTIQPFDNSVIIRAFGIDPSATYDQFKITYGEAIQKMANALKMTLYGTLGNGQMVPLTDAELIAFVNAQNCSPMRKHILTTALSLVGKVPYFWGGKSAPGWNDAWNTPRLVTSAGSPTTGTIRPFGLDCSGFTTWVFNTAVGVEIGAGCNGQYPNTYGISAAELLPGDLGFLADDDGWGHVLIFAGYDAEGTRMWVHSSGGIGVILNTPSYEGRLSYRRLSIVDYDAPVANAPTGEALYTLEVEVTHYCACAKCCGSNAQGLTASGKQAAVGMVAMSSHYPFGTQIMINGTMYTVEDRGGSGIENNIHRVDIYVPDHQQALRMGRYTTTATIYRLGR